MSFDDLDIGHKYSSKFETEKPRKKVFNNCKHFRGKCAEVFLENGMPIIKCEFCEHHLVEIKDLISHIYEKHLLIDPKLESFDEIDEELIDVPEADVCHAVEGDVLHKEQKVFVEDEESGQSENNPKTDELKKEKNENDILSDENPITNKYGLYPCKYCAKSFATTYRLYLHIKRHANDKNFHISNFENTYGKNFDVCKISENLIEFRDISTECRTKDGKYKCEACVRNFGSLNLFREHYFIKHNPGKNHFDEKLFKCQYCSKQFVESRHKQQHEKIHKTDRERFACKYCPKSFFEKRASIEHQKAAHEGITFDCKQCDRKFVSRPALRGHVIRRHKEKSYVCDQCGKAFIANNLLKRHLLKHTNVKPFKCESCPMSYCNKKRLNLHSLDHHTEILKKSYKFKNISM